MASYCKAYFKVASPWALEISYWIRSKDSLSFLEMFKIIPNVIYYGCLLDYFKIENNCLQCYFYNIPDDSILNKLNKLLNNYVSFIIKITCLFFYIGFTFSCHFKQKSWNSKFFYVFIFTNFICENYFNYFKYSSISYHELQSIYLIWIIGTDN